MTIALSSPPLYTAQSMPALQKKRIALEAVSGQKTLTCIADENNTSRKFVRRQSHDLQTAINTVFDKGNAKNDTIIYYLPVTKCWVEQFVLALMLVGRVSYRNIITLLKDIFDYDISLGTINTIFSTSVKKARGVNAKEDLSAIEVTSNDELFHQNKPVLSGIDVRSLYCYLLSAEDRRDKETWVINLMEAKAKGLSPTRTIGDDARGLVAGHGVVFPEVPYDYDNFHLSRALMDLRRYFRNRLKSSITALHHIENKKGASKIDEVYSENIISARKRRDQLHDLSTTLDTLISWLEHDILNKAGINLKDRRELYDFVVDEFKKLEGIEPKKIKPVRTLLENKQEMVLGFVDALEEKFVYLSIQFSLPIETLWAMCQLQRYGYGGDRYYFQSLPLQLELGDDFDKVEEAVLEVMNATERTSSMVENLNGRARQYIRHRIETGHGYLDLLRFFLNHKPLERSARIERRGKTPAEILSGKSHPHWLELLGFERFKRAA